MQIVRKKLTADELSAPGRRYNPDDDTVEIQPCPTCDWVPDPGSDPRHADVYRVPPLATSDPRCDAAANMVAALQAYVDLCVAEATIVGLANAILLLLSFIPGFGLFIALILAIASLIIDLTGYAINAAFTSQVYDDLLCVFYNHIDSNGQVSESQLADIVADIAANFDAVVQAVTNTWFSLIGEVQLSNIGATGTETGDCDPCLGIWCAYYLFSESDWGWELGGELSSEGQYIPGEYWESTQNGTGKILTIKRACTLGTAVITHIEVAAHHTPTTGSPTRQVQYGTSKVGLFNLPNQDFNEWDGELHDGLLWVKVHSLDTSGDQNRIFSILISGTGTKPADIGGDDCP